MAVRYRAEYTSGRGTTYRADVWDRTYTGPIRAFDAGPDGHLITTEGTDDDRFSPIKGTRCTLPVLVETTQLDDFIEDIAARPERDFAILIYEEGVLQWFGFIAPDLLQQDDISYPYIVELSATDGLGSLKMPYDFTELTTANMFANIQEFIHELLAYNGLNVLLPAHHPWLRVNMDWHASVLGPFTLQTLYEAAAQSGEFTVDAQAVSCAQNRLTLGRRTGSSVLSVFGMAYRATASSGAFVQDVGAINCALSRAASGNLVATGNYGSITRNDWEASNIQRVALVDNYGAQASFTPPPVGEMLARIMQAFGARIYFDGGSFCIDQLRSLPARYVDVHVYYPDGSKAYVIDQEDRQIIISQQQLSPAKRLAGGMRRYMRPLREVLVNFSPNLNLNLANIRFPGFGQVAGGNVQADEDFSLLYRGDYRMVKLEEGQRFFFKVWLRIEIRIAELGTTDDWYFTNGDPSAASNRYHWKASEGQWVKVAAGQPKQYYHVLFSDFTQSSVQEATNTVEFRTKAIPADGVLSFAARFNGLINASNIYTPVEPLGIRYVLLEIKDGFRATANEQMVFVVNDEVNNDRVQYRVTRTVNTDANYVVDDVRLGDGPLAILPSSVLFFFPQSLPVTSGGWKRYTPDAYEELGQILASEIMYGQQKAITKFDMVVLSQQPIRLRNILRIDNRLYTFNGVKKYALRDEYEGTWFEIAEDVTGLTKSKDRLLRAFASQPVPVASIGSSGDALEPALDLGINILRRMQVTELTSEITAGTYTSLPIASLGEAFLQAGDQLGLVNLGTGQIFNVQLSAGVTGAATSISINSIALPNLPVGSFIIFTGRRLARMVKVIDSGTIANLPISSAGLGNETTPVQINTTTGNASFDGAVGMANAQVAEELSVGGGEVIINAVDGVTANAPVEGTNVTAQVALNAGTKATIDAATGNISADGNVAAAGNVSGDELIAAVALKAGSVFEVSAATGDVVTDGDVTAAGNLAAAQVQADVLRAGTKATIDAVTGSLAADGDVVAQGEINSATAVKAGANITLDAATGTVSASKADVVDVAASRFLDVDDKTTLKGSLVLTGIDEAFVALNQVYMESDDAGGFYLKIKV